MLSVILRYSSIADGSNIADGSKTLGRLFAAMGVLRSVLDFFGEDFLGLTGEVLLRTFLVRVRVLARFMGWEDLGFLGADIFDRRVFSGHRARDKNGLEKGTCPRDRERTMLN